MRTLTGNELQIFENLVGLTQGELRNVLYRFLKQNYEHVIYDEDFLVAEGDIPIALAAHMDTVFKTPALEVFYDRKKNVMWSPTGLGADDRAGIFAILQIILSGLRPHIIFTTDEEIGCVGATELSYLPCPFKELRFIIQIDRRNANDCVFYDCDNSAFEKYIEGFGFVTNWGTFTDITEICPRWGVAGVNLSVGYRDEHTTSEILFVGQMLSTIDKVKKILTSENIPTFKYIPAVSAYYDWYPMHDAFKKDDLPLSKKTSYRCRCCGQLFPEADVLPAKLIKGGIGYFCSTCLPYNVEFCRECGEAFEIDELSPHSLYCKQCSKKLGKKYGNGNNQGTSK